MDRDPIDQVGFWKERIDDAQKRKMIHRSVYIVHPRYWAAIEKVHRQVCGRLISKDSNVLDAGCGYGRLSGWFDHSTGIEFSPDFISLAETAYPGKTFLQVDFRELPFKDCEFDWAVCVSIKAMYIGRKGQEEWGKIEKELKRVAKKVLILEYITPEIYEVV